MWSQSQHVGLEGNSSLVWTVYKLEENKYLGTAARLTTMHSDDISSTQQQSNRGKALKKNMKKARHHLNLAPNFCCSVDRSN